MQVTWIGSPNYDTNRKPITTVVIHWFGVGYISGADVTFQKPGGTSAHYAIENEIVHQYVKEEHVAYHAGVYSMNQKSIGIEHSATPTRPATESTYRTSGELVAGICKRYNIPLDRQHIIKHSEVPRATQCCGTVDVDKIIRLAKEFSQTTPPNMIDQKKATQVDQSLNYLKEKGYIADNDSNHYLEGEFTALIKRLHADLVSNQGRAGKWDQLCLKAGLMGDSNLVTVQELYDKLKSGIDKREFVEKIITLLRTL